MKKSYFFCLIPGTILILVCLIYLATLFAAGREESIVGFKIIIPVILIALYFLYYFFIIIFRDLAVDVWKKLLFIPATLTLAVLFFLLVFRTLKCPTEYSSFIGQPTVQTYFFWEKPFWSKEVDLIKCAEQRDKALGRLVS